MFFHLLTFLSTVLLLSLPCYSQKDPAWDDTRAKNWPPQAQKTLILSSWDRKEQPVYFYKAPGNTPKPLIVSLHTWSGDYQQKDTLVHFCIERGYHYIHPDFRGANQHPDALGSDLVVSDIDDAISYMLNNANVDLQNIHVIGVSGGGHATAVTYMKSKHDIRSFSAYVGIYDLVNWHQESTGRGNKYAGDIAAATTGNRKLFDAKEAKRRSPFYMETPVAKRKNSSLHLYVGIHDGYTGSVPVSQTLEFYNKVVGDFQHEAGASLIPQAFIYSMVKNRSLPGIHISESFLDRKIIYQNQYRNTVRVTVFEGSHEMPAGDVLSHVPARTILAIGDSNGAMEGGWVDQLQKLRPYDQIINTCVSGNTIGFDNLGRPALNTLKTIDTHLDNVSGKLASIVIMLGTNDCKAEFDGQFNQIAKNLEQLLEQIRKKIDKKPELGHPEIVVISPPPYGSDEKVNPKYKGGAKKVAELSGAFWNVANKQQIRYINSHQKLSPIFSYLSEDGVHLNATGQNLLASIIQEGLTSER